MKYNCDHCGKRCRDDRHTVGNDKSLWCTECVSDNYPMLEKLGLTDDVGMPIYISKSTELILGLRHNVELLAAIPPKTTKTQTSVAAAKQSVPVPVVQPAFDFDTYNRTLPGKRYGR